MGSFSVEGASLLLQRGDSARWGEVDLATWSRSGAEAYGPAGHHRWGFQGRWTAGDHVFAGSFAQRGAASRLESFEEQAARGESGQMSWAWAREARAASVTMARAWDSRESFGPDLLESVRDAGGLRGEARARAGSERASAEARLGFEELDVRRDVDPGFDRTGRAISAGLQLRGGGGAGALTLDVAAARHVVTDRTGGLDTLDGQWQSGRWIVAPEIAYRIGGRGTFAALTLLGRPTPVWADLAPDQTPFLQVARVAALEAGARRADGSYVTGRVAHGRAEDRAILFRLPLEEQWLRLGAVRDPENADFTLGSVEGEWRVKSFRVGGDLFGLARRQGEIQPRVDPAAGFRGWIETRVRFFEGDLGVVLRADVAGVGERESEATAPLAIPGYVTFGATARLELGDALIVIRARSLENQKRPQPWIDLTTGREALSPGLAIETSLTWTLFD